MITRKHVEKKDFVLRDTTSYQFNGNYIYMKEGFNLIDNEIFFNVENKKKYDSLVENNKGHIFRIKYGKYSRFFTLDDLEKENKKSLLDYSISNNGKPNNSVIQRVPLDTFIQSDNLNFSLKNYVLSIVYDDIVENALELPKYPIRELEKGDDGLVIHYIKDSNTLLFNGNDSYYNIKEVIEKGLLRYYSEYQREINGSINVFKDVLVFNRNIVGKIVNDNKIFTDNSNARIIHVRGTDFDVTSSMNQILEKYENIVYYQDLDKIIGTDTYNEYIEGDLVFYEDSNNISLVTKNGLKKIDVINIDYSYNSPIDLSAGKIWFDISMSCLRIFDGFTWKILSKPSLETICKKIELDKKFGLSNDNYLEVYGFNKPDEFMTIEMVMSGMLVYDVGFAIEDNFVDSIFINGEEISNFKDAAYGVHLETPLSRGDLFQAIITKKKEFTWVEGTANDINRITLLHPFEIVNVKKLFINNEEYNVDYIDNNIISTKHLMELNGGEIIVNPCDRIKAKVQDEKLLCDFYPEFKVEYKEFCDFVELPFNIDENRFDSLMITNNGEEVILNPEIILDNEALFAYYNISEPNKLRFSRNILPEDSILVQFINHKPCSFNPESMLENSLTPKDISDKLVLDSIVSFEDPTITMNYVLQKIDDIIENNKPGGSIGSSGNTNSNENIDENTNGENGVNQDDKDKIKENTIDKIIIGGMNVGTKTEDEKLQDIIDSVSKPGNPDISEGFINNKPIPYIPPGLDTSILVRPSNTYMKPSYTIVMNNPSQYKKYNLEFTENYMAARNELKKYLYGLNNKLSNVISELSYIRQALRDMINYLCNTMCLDEVLKTIMEGFNQLVGGLQGLMGISKGNSINKLSNLMSMLKDKLNSLTSNLKDSLMNLIGLAKDKVLGAWNSAKNFAMGMLSKAKDLYNNISDQVMQAWGSLKGLFNKFKKTEIGNNVGKYKSKFWDKIKNSLSKVGDFMKKAIKSLKKVLGNVGKSLKSVWDKIKNFDYKSFFKSLSLDQLINFICDKVLKGLLDSLDYLLDILRYLQKRFQSFLNKLFAENYRSPLTDLKYLGTMATFFRSHINICQILRELWADPSGFSFAKFLKRVTNLETIFYQWKRNKNILKGMGKNFNPLKNGASYNPGTITDLAGAGNSMTNSILMMDELFGTNEKTIESIIFNLKRAFIFDFKTTTGSILDKQAMSRQIFSKNKFSSLAKKLVPW